MPEPTFRAPKGTRDLLAPQSTRQRTLVDSFARCCERSGYGEIVSPMFEDAAVFLRVGESTEVVSKEMYEFRDRDDRHLALRPELTASVARAFVQHRPPTPWKVWYEGPQFRCEKPQAGRYRQFFQVGAEVFGSDDPMVDVELIALADRFFREIGLTGVTLLINSLGDPSCRPQYLDALEAHLRARAAELSPASRQTLDVNPLRVLDSKRPEDEAVIADAPLMVDHLSPEPARHFAAVLAGLDALEIAYELSPRLVRGLDYYTKTTFEFAATTLETAQNAVGGGGRYDGLVESLGGPPTAGIGFALGVDRILLTCDAEGVLAPPDVGPEVFVIDLTGGVEAARLGAAMSDGGIRSDRAFDNRSIKAQMRSANRSGAAFAVIVGEDELAASSVELKDLSSGHQQRVERDRLVDLLREMLR